MAEPTPSRYRRELKTGTLTVPVRTRRGSLAASWMSPGIRTRTAGALVDARNAILLDEVDVCLVDPNPGEPEEHGRVALTLAGRVNMRDERSSVLFMFGADGAAAIVTQLVGLAARAGDPYAAEFAGLVEARMGEMP